MKDAIDPLYALHSAVILIADFVFPSAEAPSGVEADGFEFSIQDLKMFVALQVGGWISVSGAVNPGRNYVTTALNKSGVEGPLNCVFDKVFSSYGFFR